MDTESSNRSLVSRLRLGALGQAADQASNAHLSGSAASDTAATEAVNQARKRMPMPGGGQDMSGYADPTKQESPGKAMGTSDLGAMVEVMKARSGFIRQLGKVLLSAERARAREIMRITRRRGKAALRKAARARINKSAAPAEPKRNKRSARDLVEDAEARSLYERFRHNAKKTRADELRLIAREVGISVKKLKHISSLLAEGQLQEFISRNRLTIPRLGSLRLAVLEPRLRSVNATGQIGRDGRQVSRLFPVSVIPRFRAAAGLKKAIYLAEIDLGKTKRRKGPPARCGVRKA